MADTSDMSSYEAMDCLASVCIVFTVFLALDVNDFYVLLFFLYRVWSRVNNYKATGYSTLSIFSG